MTKIFAVYDSKAEAWHSPIFRQSRGVALRAWETVANDKQTEIGQYPGDFTLFEIGDFDPESGNITCYEAKISLGTALEFIKEENT